MWMFKLVLLLALLATWIKEVKSEDLSYSTHITTNQEPEPGSDDEEENEELAA